MNKFLFSISLLILITSPLVTAQQRYYVDANGYELGNGTLERPWKSLYRACQIITTEGSIIHINPGTYVENRICNLAPGVSIEGENAAECIITSTTLYQQYTPIIAMNSSSITDGNQSISNLTFDGRNETIAQAISIIGRNNVSIHDCIFKDFHYMAIWWTGLFANEQPIYASGNSFHDNMVTNCAIHSEEYARGALTIGGQDKMMIYNNYISQTGRPTGQNGWPLKVWANEGYIKDSKIYNNILYKDDLANWDFCIEMNHVSGLEIFGNHINGSVDSNYQFKGEYDYSIYIHDNVIGLENPRTEQNFGICLEFTCETSIVRNNIIKNVDVGINFSSRVDTYIVDFEASYNVFSNISAYGGVRVLEAGTTLSDFRVFNNVFIGNPEYRNFSGVEFRSGGWTSVANITVANNIFMNFDYWFFTKLPGTAYKNLLLENNILYNNGIDNGEWFPDGIPASFIKRNNIIRKPIFVSDSDFHLLANSPGIKSGVSLPNMTIDLDGESVGSKPNIGAYEAIGNNSVPSFAEAYIDNDRSKIRIDYNIPLSNVKPSISAFKVKLNNEYIEISAVDIVGGDVIISLATETQATDIITLTYTKQETDWLRSTNGKATKSFVNNPVRNKVEL